MSDAGTAADDVKYTADQYDHPETRATFYDCVIKDLAKMRDAERAAATKLEKADASDFE